jgi:hypothetical protein
LSTIIGRVVEGLAKLIDGFGQLGIIATKKDVFVGGIDVLNVGLLEDCFGLPSKRYEGDDLEVAADEGVGTRG